MLQSQYGSGVRKRPVCVQDRNQLLKRYPVVLPLLLLAGACFAAIISLVAEDIFPLLTWIGVSPSIFCLSIALVLGISGTLTSIIGIIEHIDGWNIQKLLFPASRSIGLFGFINHVNQNKEVSCTGRYKVLLQAFRGYCTDRGYWNNRKEQKLC